MHTYKHIHAAIRKNDRKGLVFPLRGRVGHLVVIIIITIIITIIIIIIFFINSN